MDCDARVVGRFDETLVDHDDVAAIHHHLYADDLGGNHAPHVPSSDHHGASGYDHYAHHARRYLSVP